VRRRLLAALVPLAALAVALSGCAPQPVYSATTSNASNVWIGRTSCDFSARKGGDFDIVRTTLERDSSEQTITVTFTLRRPPRTDQAAAATITFRNSTGTRAGFLVTRWTGRTAKPIVAELDRTTGWSTVLATAPVVDARARTITTTYPTDLFDWGGHGFWYWNADTYVRGKHRDNCTNHPRPLEPDRGAAYLRQASAAAAAPARRVMNPSVL
jgi:hypothetical protein